MDKYGDILVPLHIALLERRALLMRLEGKAKRRREQVASLECRCHHIRRQITADAGWDTLMAEVDNGRVL